MTITENNFDSNTVITIIIIVNNNNKPDFASAFHKRATFVTAMTQWLTMFTNGSQI